MEEADESDEESAEVVRLRSGIEKALEGQEKGFETTLTLAPADAFGERDEDLVVEPGRVPERGVPAKIIRVEDLGRSKIVTTALGADTLTVRLAEEARISDGACWLVFPPEHSLLYRDSRLCTKPGVGRP